MAKRQNPEHIGIPIGSERAGPVPPDPKHFVDLVDGRFAETNAADLAALFANAQSAEHLVIHFHGGLVGRDSALATGMDLIQTYRDGGAYPIFFLWNSDLPSVIKGSWNEIPNEKAFERLVRRLAQLAIGKLKDAGARRGGAIQLPSMREIPRRLSDVSGYLGTLEGSLSRDSDLLTDGQIRQVERELDTDPVLRDESVAIALSEQREQRKEIVAARGAIPKVSPKATLMSAGVREDIRRDTFATPGEPALRGAFLLTLARHGAAILFNVVRRFINHRDHGLYTTIVEETMRRLYVDSLGQLAWELMKADTRDAFGNSPQCGGTALLKHLALWHSAGRRITLVGHSTGAVYIGNLLSAADATLSADVPFEAVFLAAACTFEFMYARLPVYRRRVGDRIRSFGLGAEREHGYFEVPVLYEGSLLYMVSGLFEMTEVDKEIVGMQRFFRKENAYDDLDCLEVRSYLDGKTVWSECAGPEGRRCNAPKHGGFPSDTWTRESLIYILKNGIT
jgi:hypothetical protein